MFPLSLSKPNLSHILLKDFKATCWIWEAFFANSNFFKAKSIMYSSKKKNNYLNLPLQMMDILTDLSNS